MDAKTKEVARPLNFETLCLANELSKCNYLDVALSMIEDAFNKELGATSGNSIIVEIMPEGEKPDLTEFVNTTDKNVLYPELKRICLEDAKGLPKDKQEKVKYFLDAFIKFQGETNNAQEPQQISQQDKELERYCQRAIDKGYLVKTENGYKRTEKWTKSQLAYFLRCIYPSTFPEKKLNLLFDESRLGKAASQLMDNKTGDGKPRNFQIVDELF